MILRSRSSRLAALSLAFTAPLAAAYTLPAFAAGDSAVVSASVTEGSVHVSSTKGLSRVTIVYCDGTSFATDKWSKDQLSGDVEVDGVVEAVFVHSGSNTTDEAQALLAQLAGADAVNGDSTGAIAVYDAHACDPTTPDPDPTPNLTPTPNPDPTPNPNPTPNPDPTPNLNPTPNATPDPTPSVQTATNDGETVVLGVTIEKPANPQAPTAVLAQTGSAGAELPRTGSVHVQSLVALGFALIAAGLALKAAFTRRIRPASFPG